jgi:hypothetical protein
MDGGSDAPAGKATFGLATESDELEFYVLSMAIFSSNGNISFAGCFYGYLKLCLLDCQISPHSKHNFI